MAWGRGCGAQRLNEFVATKSVCSLPPCGGGLGRGGGGEFVVVARDASANCYPHPQPLPTRGRGADRVCGSRALNLDLARSRPRAPDVSARAVKGGGDGETRRVDGNIAANWAGNVAAAGPDHYFYGVQFGTIHDVTVATVRAAQAPGARKGAGAAG